MANVINTRIQLKYDTLSNWNGSTFKPLKGEICIAKVDVTQPENGLLQPIMFKVGDGDHTFAELGWTSAKAADVYAWAKAAELPVDDTLATEGKFVVGFDWEGDKLVPKFRDFVTEINETNKDKLDAPTTKAVKTYVDGKIADVVAQGTVVAAGDGIDVAQNGNTYTVSHENTSDVADVTAAARTYITGLTFDEFGHVTGTTVGTEADQDLSNYKTKQEVVEETGAANQTLKISQNENGVITTEAVDIAITSAQVTDLDTGVHAVSLASGTNNGTVKLTVDGQATDNIAVTGLGSAAFTDSTAYAPQTTTYTKNEVDTEIDNAVKGLLGEDVSEAYDTFKELQIILDGSEGAQGLIDEVAANKEAIEDLVDGTTAAKKASSLDEAGVAQVKGIKVDAAITADNYTADGGIDTAIKAAAKAGADAAKVVEDGVKDGTIKAAKATDAETLGGVAPNGYKTKQTVVANPTANGTASAFIDSITQNENGEIVVTKKNMNIPSFYYQEGEGLIFGNNKVQLQSSNLSFSYGYDENGYMDTSGDRLKIEVSVIDKTNLDTEINESLELANTAIQADDLHPVATSGSIYDLEEVHKTTDATIAGGNYLIFNCGSATKLI